VNARDPPRNARTPARSRSSFGERFLSLLFLFSSLPFSPFFFSRSPSAPRGGNRTRCGLADDIRLRSIYTKIINFSMLYGLLTHN
jgi:hypothetical protein